MEVDLSDDVFLPLSFLPLLCLLFRPPSAPVLGDSIACPMNNNQ